MTSIKQIEKAGQKEGLEVWRIENLEIIPVPVEQHGVFYTGDSYILLRTKTSRGGIPCSWDLHFWLGKESTQDERGAAAILTSQIDDYLKGLPVQHREIQNAESPVFRGYFKKGIIYKKGGVDSAFNPTKTNQSDVKRLLHVKGSRTVRATEVEMSWKSFNKGDIFILEVGNEIIQWNGSKSNRYERLKACELVNSIKNDEKGGKGRVTVIEEGRRPPTVMMKTLSGTPEDVGPEILDDVVISQRKLAKLYHVSSDTGILCVNQIATAPFLQESLLSGDCFIVDNGSDGIIFVWKGKQASKDERSGAMENAVKFIKENNYAATTKIQVMAEGAESVLFTQFFKNWKKKNQSLVYGESYQHGKVDKIEKITFNVKSLFNKPKVAATQRMIDDGSGKVQVWSVNADSWTSVAKDKYGLFNTESCYIILYTYTPQSKDEYVIYYWFGLDAQSDTVASTAHYAARLNKKLDQRAVMCRVVQGKEPKHLLSIFDRPIIISMDGYLKNSGKDVEVALTALYQVRSTTAGGTKLIQVETSSKMLNSNDAFLIIAEERCFVWVGVGANDFEIDAAQYGAERLTSGHLPISNLEEGEESGYFWHLLGGKKEYASFPRLQQDFDTNPPKLFAISDARGHLFVEEIPGEFAQSDLQPDDIMMLDSWDQVFIWIGDGANEHERTEAPKLVQEYLNHDPRGRDPLCPIIHIKMNAEPVTFTGFFPSWDRLFFEKRVSQKNV